MFWFVCMLSHIGPIFFMFRYERECCGQTNQISIIICTILVVPFLLWMCVGMCNTKLRRERQRRGVVSGEDIQTRYFQSRWRQDE